MIEAMTSIIFIAITASLTVLVWLTPDPLLRQVFGGTLVMVIIITVIAACYALMKTFNAKE